MKNKKSKIVVPALALILLSTAASISGSVAWFTASRTATVKTGQFTVVKTGDDLDVELHAVAGINTEISNNTLQQKANYNLTDSSFDHTFHDATAEGGEWRNWKSPYVVKPDVPRQNVLDITQLGTGISANKLTPTADLEDELERGTKVYSAYVWTITFNIDFSASSTDDQGLFLDLSSVDTHMYTESALKNQNDSIEGWYADPDCSGPIGEAGAKHTSATPKTYYKPPKSTGIGFRIAFIPTEVPEGSMGYAKVWGDNEGSTEGEGKFVSGHGVMAAEKGTGTDENPQYAAFAANTLAGTSYNNSTLSFDGDEFDSATTGAGKVLMRHGDNTPVPADNTLNADTALSQNSNFLGYFKCPGSETTVSMTYTCVAWYEGTNPYVNSGKIVNTDENSIMEPITTSMKFGVCNLN